MPNEYKKNEKIDLFIKVTDNRYPIDVNVDDKDNFTLYFNPGDPFLLRYVDNIKKLEAPANEEDYLNFADNMEKNIDAIFGDGTAKLVFKYDGVERLILSALVDKVKEGQADYEEKAKIIEAEARKKASDAAKAESKAFIASKNS